jgi:tetratricopeptide (TPR) repeat protein
MREPTNPHPDSVRRGERTPRIEPSFEHWDELQFSEREGHGDAGVSNRGSGLAAFTSRRARPIWAAIAIIIAVAALLLVLRQPLSDWLWPETRAQQLRDHAAQALAQGKLTSPDGHGARELYEAALALDPDRTDARAGLARVGQAALAQARRALIERRYADAHRSVALARELAVPTTQVDTVVAVLRRREAAEAGIDRLLPLAAAARSAGKLDGDETSALWIYQRVLELQPTHTQALEGRDDTLTDLLQHAQQALARGELATAAAIVHRVRAADPGHAGLPGALADLSQASERRRRSADADVRNDRLSRAGDSYRAVLAVDPTDEEAMRGMTRLATAYARRSERLAADFRFDEADAALGEANAINPDTAAIAEARQHLARARQSQSRYGSTKLSGADRQRRLRQWLQEAAEAEERGDLLTPPGDSAFDKLRSARAIAPRDARVLQASARLLPAAKACFEKELRGNRLNRARECLDARRVLEGDSAALGESRRRLAQRWVAVGNERLGAGEVQAAQWALTSARTLDPGAPGLDEFAERLRAAAAAD